MSLWGIIKAAATFFLKFASASNRENDYTDMLFENELFGNLLDNLDQTKYYRANRTFLLKQRAILKAFRHMQCPSLLEHREMYILSQTYNPKNHLKDYKDPQLVLEYVNNLESGRYLSRTESFTTAPSPIDQLIKLSQILDSAFNTSWDLFYKTLSYFFPRVNMVELYTSLNFIVSSLRTEGYRLPPPYEVFPQMFTPKDILFQLNEMGFDKLIQPIGPIFLSSKRGLGLPEEQLAYFREDSSINSFHSFWHIDFPFWYNKTIHNVHKDRKGELFLYMHHNVLARYFAERISLGYPNVESLDFDKPLNPGNAPNILNVDFQEFPLRAPGVFIQDITNITVSGLKALEVKMLAAVNDGFFTYANGSIVSIRNDKGNDVLGDAIEATLESPHMSNYGSLHNNMHGIISQVSDANNELKLPQGVLAHQEASMTDPVFYKIHKYVEDVNKLQHDYLAPYTRNELDFSGVRIKKLNVQTEGMQLNELQTYFHNVSWDITNAVKNCGEGISRANVYSNVRQLDHKDFQYNIEVESEKNTSAVIRIFIAPSQDFNGDEPTVDAFRWSFFEMDKIFVKLKQGKNSLTRQSSESSVTVPRYYSWKTLNEKIEIALATSRPLYVNKYSRHCGWPHHYLLPRGRPSGMEYKLFAIVTDFNTDINISFNEALKLKSLSMCTVVKGLVPDIRPFGFPFERKIQSTWNEFLTENMIESDIIIKHKN